MRLRMKEMNLGKYYYYICAILCLTILISPALASTATQITNSQGGLYFTGSISDPGTFYQDAIGSNIDAGLRLCGHGQRYVGGFYGINVSGTPIYTLVTYQSSSNALAYTDDSVGGGCYDVTPGFLTFSPSQLITPNPDVSKAAFPAQLWTGYSVSANPGTVSTFELGQNDSYLRGNYTAIRSFDYTTAEVTVQMPSIVFQSSSSEFIKSASDSDFGISSDRKMVAGLCLDAYGSDCSDGALYTSSASFPETYTSDLTIGSIDDTATYDRFVVFNGLGLPMCIGANLKISIDEITPTNSYYGQTLTIATTVTNELDSPYEIAGGNVPVTTAFYIRFVIFNSSSGVVYNSSFPVATTLLPDGTTQYNLSYPVNIRSGQYTVLATVDSSSTVVECNESDNNATSSFNIYSVIIPQIQIDGVNSTAFAYPNVPYWINVSITDSDNNSISNATVQFVEVNGLNINVGTQAYNISDSVSTLAKSGAVGKSIVEVTTNYQGNVSFTYIPTYNQLYDSQYTYLRLSQYVGATQRYMTGVLSNGTSFSFLVNNSITDQYPLTVTNNTYNVTVIQKNILNNLTMVQSFDNIYRTFANFISAFIG